MPLGETVSTALFILAGGSGLLLGAFGPQRIQTDPPSRVEEDSLKVDPDEKQTSINLAILYATLALVISSIVSQWPPEGQTIHPIFTTLIFVGSVFAAAFIMGRVSRLVFALEKHGTL